MRAEITAPYPETTIVPEKLREKPSIPLTVHETIESFPYDTVLLWFEEKYKHVQLSWAAKKSPDIPIIFSIVEEITWDTSINGIRDFLLDTANNPVRSRTDLQRCGAILQKIAGINDIKTIDWGFIFSRLDLEQKKAA